jgi:hypothetical protein
MKVAINKCFGEFSLSPKAVKRLAELEGKECYFFKSNYDKDEGVFVCNLSDIETVEKEFCFFAYSSLDIQDSSTSISTSPENRHCPNLIKVIEELGDDANGKHSKIKIVEIPDGVDYEIDDYSGMGRESISEVCRTWS